MAQMGSRLTKRIVPPAWPGREQHVAHGIPCRACGHDVRGLGATERCPFCGAAAGLTLEGELLRFADPRWVQVLRRGIALIFIALFVFIFGCVAAAAMQMKDPHHLNSILWLALLTTLASATLSMAGTWLLTRRDPSGAGENLYGRSRRIVRLTLLLAFLILPAGAISITLIAGPTLPRVTTVVVESLRVAASVTTAVGVFALLDYLRKLVRKRLRDPILSPRLDFLFRALGISHAIATAAMLIYRYAVLAQVSMDVIALVMLLVLVTALPALVFWLMYLFSLERLRIALGEAVKWAEQTWARPPDAVTDDGEFVGAAIQ